MTSELPRPVVVDRMPGVFAVEASAEECAALALRLRIDTVQAVTCRFALRRQGNIIEAEGALDARVVQTCVVTLAPVEQRVAERFIVRFVPAGQETDDEDPESPDELAYDGSSIDLGEAAAQQLALALDPYPRSPGAVLDESAQDAPETPFSRLSALRTKL
jgi:uncharacterized metal-binding protein YceD (DUF177 family)